MLNVDGWTDGRTNVQTDERTKGRTNERKLARLCLPAKAGATKRDITMSKKKLRFTSPSGMDSPFDRKQLIRLSSKYLQ